MIEPNLNIVHLLLRMNAAKMNPAKGWRIAQMGYAAPVMRVLLRPVFAPDVPAAGAGAEGCAGDSDARAAPRDHPGGRPDFTAFISRRTKIAHRAGDTASGRDQGAAVPQSPKNRVKEHRRCGFPGVS
ncbi:hypothetical protein D2T31_08740 [Sinirhodobacter populi]|uniref:Uncharacterized protein n=1 Tax=Paenirhodobacter populi TaxID=2306993 RepID=A0A443KBF3_9RHOB|nr:hypothetical protein [Sinirhodobacter populi]RWR29973.1 hypothetical protein D2T31_08740 [Sinirhodobacter populi]